MAEPHFPGDDDLPRTFRREREAREREAAALSGMAHATSQGGGRDYGPPPQDYGAGAADSLYSAGMSGTVTRFEVPFLHLVTFFLKAALAAIPALLLLGVVMFGAGKVLQAVFPAYRLFEIKIQSIDPAAPATPAPTSAKGNPPAAKKP
ncbi:MAG: hypothetical protein ACKVP7_11950 [Hyphomicrobiaceae bacterium]